MAVKEVKRLQEGNVVLSVEKESLFTTLQAKEKENMELSRTLIAKSEKISSLENVVQAETQETASLRDAISSLQQENVRLVKELKKFSVIEEDNEVDPVSIISLDFVWFHNLPPPLSSLPTPRSP